MSATQHKRREKSPIKNRILQYLEYKHISRYCFYRDSGVARGVLEQPTGISEENLEKFMRYARDISPIWLICGVGPMLKTDPGYLVSRNYFPQIKPVPAILSDVSAHYHAYTRTAIAKHDVLPHFRVPLFELKGHATLSSLLGGETGNECTAGHIDIPGLPICDGALHIRGETRCSPLSSGDIAIYKVLSAAESLIFGELYLLSLDVCGDEFMLIRYIRQGKHPDTVVLDEGTGIAADAQEIARERIRALAIVKVVIRFNTLR